MEILVEQSKLTAILIARLEDYNALLRELMAGKYHDAVGTYGLIAVIIIIMIWRERI